MINISLLTLKIIFVAGQIGFFLIRYPHHQNKKENQIVRDRKTLQENILLLCVSVGMLILPFIYVFTPWLSFADYPLISWLNITGIVVYILSLYLFWKSHHDLGKNWSPTLEIREQHTLIIDGIYKKIRHPMYTSIWLWCIAQALLLPNYIAGFSGIISFALLYFLRVDNEEKMMLEQFGEDYERYMQNTGRLLPKF